MHVLWNNNIPSNTYTYKCMYNLYTTSDCYNKCILINKYSIILSMPLYNGVAVHGTI